MNPNSDTISGLGFLFVIMFFIRKKPKTFSVFQKDERDRKSFWKKNITNLRF